MAYYTGSVNSYDELLTALVNACTANGWAWNGGILSKGVAFVKPTAFAGSNQGVRIEGGTGQSGTTLINPSPQGPRLGRIVASPPYYKIADATWPSQYHVHIGVNPDEVYVVLNTNVTLFYWLAFGVSVVPMPGTGLWLAGNAAKTEIGGGNWAGLSVGEESASGSPAYYGCPCLFWVSAFANADSKTTVCQSASGGVWPAYTPVGVTSLVPLIKRYERTWNKTAVLLPAREYEDAGSNKQRLLIDAAHARIVRLGNLEAGQILQLGADKWRVYPFLQKDAANPNSEGPDRNKTGTFGMALRYDGP